MASSLAALLCFALLYILPSFLLYPHFVDSNTYLNYILIDRWHGHVNCVPYHPLKEKESPTLSDSLTLECVSCALLFSQVCHIRTSRATRRATDRNSIRRASIPQHHRQAAVAVPCTRDSSRRHKVGRCIRHTTQRSECDLDWF